MMAARAPPKSPASASSVTFFPRERMRASASRRFGLENTAAGPACFKFAAIRGMLVQSPAFFARLNNPRALPMICA